MTTETDDSVNARGAGAEATSAACRGGWLTGWLIMVAGAPLSILAMLGAGLTARRPAEGDEGGRRAERSGV